MKKLIVSNRGALLRKYGAGGLLAIETAVQRLIAADLARGLATALEYLDQSPKLGAKKVKKATDPAQNKRAIDALCAHEGRPDYLMILGAQDVVPHQPLANLLPIGPEDDPDREVPSDLPYACDAPFSTAIKDFIGPTRAVGRLPDAYRGTDETVLVRLLDQSAAALAPRPVGGPFALTAQVWDAATREVVRRALARKVKPRISPSQDAPVPAAALRGLMHLVNCHGAPSDPKFYGDDDVDQPEAMRAKELAGRIPRGCVAAAECCYGAELYSAHALHPGICSTYLAQGAQAFVGSTNVAYGALTASLENADVICALFLEHMAKGASAGRALLEARQGFVASVKPLSFFELKTLAQFLLLGDPSLRAFAPAGKAHAAKGMAKGKALLATPQAPAAKFLARHRQHRRTLARAGKVLESWAGQRRLEVRKAAASEQAAALTQRATELGFGAAKVFTSGWSRPSGAKKTRAVSAERVWFTFGRPEREAAGAAARAKGVRAGLGAARGRRGRKRTLYFLHALVGRERHGKLSMHELVSR